MDIFPFLIFSGFFLALLTAVCLGIEINRMSKHLASIVADRNTLRNTNSLLTEKMAVADKAIDDLRSDLISLRAKTASFRQALKQLVEE